MLAKLRFLFGSCLILLTSTFVLSQTQRLSSADALLRYRKSLSHLHSVSMKITTNVDSNDHEYFPQTLDYVFRRDRDNNRAEWLGKQLIFGNEGEVDMQNSEVIKNIADGNIYIDLAGANLANEIDSRRVILRYKYTESLKELLENPNHGGPLFGKMYGSNYKSVADLLGEASNFHVHETKENINGVACFILEGTSEYGKVTAWIAPENGYNAMKWVIEKGPHHLFNDTAISQKWPGIKDWQVTYNVKELHKIISEDNTVFTPKLSSFNFHINFRDGTNNVDHYEYKVSDIQLNPDFEALGAFKIDLPEGIRVFNKDIPNLIFRWKNGKPVADVDRRFLDILDNEIEQIESDVNTKSAEATDNKDNVSQKEPPAVADTNVDTPKTERELLSESGPSLPLLLIPIGLVIIGAIGWLAFRRLRY